MTAADEPGLGGQTLPAVLDPDEEIIRRGDEAVGEIISRSFRRWITLALPAYEKLSSRVRFRLGNHSIRSGIYAREMARELEHYPHLAAVTKRNKSLWVWCRYCAPYFDEIEAWREQHEPLLTDPRRVFERWLPTLPDDHPAKLADAKRRAEREAKRAESGKAKKKEPEKTKAELKEELHRIKEDHKRAGSGSNIDFANDTYDHMADFMDRALAEAGRSVHALIHALGKKARARASKPAGAKAPEPVSRGVLMTKPGP
jgi:hypothetical protein